MKNKRLKRNQRIIVERIIIKGTLILDTPTCLGNGSADGVTDLMLLRDSISNKALLTGASITGGLRNYVNEYEFGYGKEEEANSLATYLFGGRRKDRDGEQSPLIINDSISNKVPKVELRDGVKIDSKTGTTPDGAKYDLELLAAGTEFPLFFELLVEEDKNKHQLLQALNIALKGLEDKEINIGIKKRRGFGCCHVENWQIWEFNLEENKDRLAWLSWERDWGNKYIKSPQQGKITDILQVQLPKDERSRFFIQATFKVLGSLIIRSNQAFDKTVPDTVHLKSQRNGKEESILSGTSLAGVLKHRAERIVNTIGVSKTIIDEIFGFVLKDNALSSNLIVHETVINNPTELVQNRIAIDRFTGGAYHGALFDEQAVFAQEKTQVKLNIELREPSDAEIGLLLLLIKDLWTSDLPIGGESSIGRGRLQGIEAQIKQYTPETNWKNWTIKQNREKLDISDSESLELFVKKLCNLNKDIAA